MNASRRIFRVGTLGFFIVLGLGGTPAPGQAASVVGVPRVIDGDTLTIGTTRIRLHGIDAPESRQSCRIRGHAWACGIQATRALRQRIGRQTVQCQGLERDRYGRLIAMCRMAGQDLNAWMVAQGWAFAYRRYSTRYVRFEQAARWARRGIWRGEVVPPWQWRRGQRLSSK